MRKFLLTYILLLWFLVTVLPVWGNVDEELYAPTVDQKTSITALKIAMNYIEHRNNVGILPATYPMPLMDPDYFDFGDWAFYADSYLNELLRPYLNGYGDRINLKPLELKSDKNPAVINKLSGNAALVRVEYPRHEELERLLQKLYFNLIQGPVILSVAYDPEKIVDGYGKYSNWRCFESFKDPNAGADGDVHLAYVDWDRVHCIVAFLDGGSIRVADGGKIYDVDHNALIAQANAILAIPDSRIINEKKNELNYLLFFETPDVAWKKNR